jgi:lysophospholipase L1-like esterase
MVAGKPFPRDHEGHSGWGIVPGMGLQGISDRVPSPALDDNPHIVLLHIGTNDASRGDKPGMLNNLSGLLDSIIATVPDALIVVAQIIPLPGNTAVDTYNAGIPDLVDGLAAAGKHVTYADLNTGFENTDLDDGVHPNQGGYEKMAEDWYAAIKDYLPTAQ